MTHGSSSASKIRTGPAADMNLKHLRSKTCAGLDLTGKSLSAASQTISPTMRKVLIGCVISALSIPASAPARTSALPPSPRTGRAVSAEGAGEWADKLFPLPAEMLGAGDGSRENVLAGLRITGHFLTTGLAHALGDKPLPEPRARLIDRLEKDR